MDTEGRSGKVAIDVAGQAGAAALGLVLGGPAGAVFGAATAPLLVDLVGKAWNELRDWRERNAVRVVEVAAQQTGQQPAELLSGTLNDADQSRLLYATLQAAAATLDEDKVNALARCLANGVDDAARVDEEGLIVRALTDLDPVHVRVLAMLEERGPREPFDIHLFICGNSNAHTIISSADLSRPVLAVLERHGLIDLSEEIAANRGSTYDRGSKVTTKAKCTPFGRMCLERLGHQDHLPLDIEIPDDESTG